MVLLLFICFVIVCCGLLPLLYFVTIRCFPLSTRAVLADPPEQHLLQQHPQLGTEMGMELEGEFLYPLPSTSRGSTGGTEKKEKGTKANDTFMTIVQTAKKLSVSACAYIYDRVSNKFEMTSLAQLIREKNTFN
jgi:hypothetical protein